MQKKGEPKNSLTVKKEAGKTYLLVGVSLVVVVLLVFLIIKYAPGQFAGKAIENPVQCIAAPSWIVAYWDISNLVKVEKSSQSLGEIMLVKDLIGPTNEGLIRSGGIPIWPDSGPLPSDAIVEGKIGKALKFDGKDDVLWGPSHPSLKFGKLDFTMEGWIKVEDITTPQAIALNGYISKASYGLMLNGVCGKGKICFIAIDDLGVKGAGAKLNIPLNKWTHIAVVRTGSKVIFYVNGQSEQGGQLKPGLSYNFGVIVDNPGPFSLGASVDNLMKTAQHLKGVIDEFSVYRRALKAEEIKQVYESGVNGIGKCTSEVVEVVCDDGKDNDFDGLLDCADPDCQPSTDVALDSEYEATISADACPGATVTIK